MDAQTTINLIGGSMLAILGWVGRSVWEAVARLQNDFHELEVDLPKSYVSKDDFSNTMNHIEDMFQRISDKLDAKVDKR